jgi:predicted ATPase
MKLKKFSIRGFRSLKDISWGLSDLNILIGPNGSGKSNLLRAIELLQEAGTGDLDSAIIRQGGIGALLWDGRSKEIGWKISVDPGRFLGKASGVKDLRYELSLVNLGPFFGYRIAHEILTGFTSIEEESGTSRSKYLERDLTRATFFNESSDEAIATHDQLEATRTLLSQMSWPLAGSKVFVFHEYLKNWRIYQDLAVQQESEVRKSAVSRREIKLSSRGENLISALHTLYSTERKFKVQLNDAMRAAFGNDFEELEFPPAEDQRIQMRVQWKSLKNAHSAAHLSEGTLKFLMLIAILANPLRGDLIAIDEPETYLHPSMFPIIAELAAEASKSSQIIFTTHSPEFLTAMGHHNPTTVVLQNIEGETKLNVLDQQEMKRWLDKYKLGELFISGDLEALV